MPPVLLLADEARIRRAKALACTRPLTRLDDNKGLSGLQRYALLEVALVAIETIVDSWGFESGVGEADVTEVLVEFARRQAPEAEKAEWEKVAKLVLAALVDPFSAVYGDYSQEQYRRQMFTPREGSLITEEEAADGSIYLRATNEAINVVVGALDIDVESGQAAAEARLQNLIQRGRFLDASQAAADARIRSIQYGEQIRTLIAKTRRNVVGVDWVEQAPELLERAREHLEQRLGTERALIHNLEEAREQAERPQLDLRTIARLIATLRDCSTRHMQLHGRVMQARGVFLEEQARQEFAPPASIRLFDLPQDALRPLLALSVADAEPLLERFLGRVLGPRTPRQPRLDTLLEMLLRPAIERDEFGDEVEELAFADSDAELQLIPEPVWNAAGRLLHGLAEPARLSALLAQARALPEGAAVGACLRLRALHAFGAELGDEMPEQGMVLLAYTDGAPLLDPVYGGDDLLLVECELGRAPAEAEGQEVAA
jgi:hypothetical protein